MPTDYYYAYVLSHPHAYLLTLFHLRLWILISTGLVTTYLVHTICISYFTAYVVLLTTGFTHPMAQVLMKILHLHTGLGAPNFFMLSL
jgi:hypothetical protein